MPRPLLSVSVVIPCYNAAAFIGNALASAVAQTRPPHEIVVVDDASTDGSAAIAEEWARRDGRIRLLRLPENGGDANARTIGARAATGDLVAMLDADDRWEPWHLEEVAGLLDRFPEAALASAAARLTGARSGTKVPSYPPDAPCDAFWIALAQVPHHQSTVVMRRAALLAVGGYAAGGYAATDFDLWLRLAAEHPFVCTHRVTGTYHWHDHQISRNPAKQIAAAHRYRRAYLERMRGAGSPRWADAVAHTRRVWRRDLRWAMRHRTPSEARTLWAQWRLSGIAAPAAGAWWVRLHAALAVRAVQRATGWVLPPAMKQRLRLLRESSAGLRDPLR